MNPFMIFISDKSMSTLEIWPFNDCPALIKEDSVILGTMASNGFIH